MKMILLWLKLMFNFNELINSTINDTNNSNSTNNSTNNINKAIVFIINKNTNKSNTPKLTGWIFFFIVFVAGFAFRFVMLNMHCRIPLRPLAMQFLMESMLYVHSMIDGWWMNSDWWWYDQKIGQEFCEKRCIEIDSSHSKLPLLFVHFHDRICFWLALIWISSIQLNFFQDLL